MQRIRHRYFAVMLLVAVAGVVVAPSVRIFATLSLLIVLGSLTIAWGAEAAEAFVAQGLVLAVVAWVQVFPEFMIEATIAFAGDVPNMLANFTGANRILVGVGWPLVFVTAAVFSRRRGDGPLRRIDLAVENGVEVMFLLVASAYASVIYLRGRLTLVDTVVMGGLYVLYLGVTMQYTGVSADRTGHVRGMSARIARLPPRWKRPIIAACFLGGGALIFLVADPFYHGALAVATGLGVSEFLFIQWVAPFLSEFPEKTSAFYWASRVDTAPMALMNVITSKLTQWTLLLALIPVAYLAGTGDAAGIPLDTAVWGSYTAGQDLLLTLAESVFAGMILLKLRFYWYEATLLFAAWTIQFIWVGLRPEVTLLYFLGAAALGVLHRKRYVRVGRELVEMMGLIGAEN